MAWYNGGDWAGLDGTQIPFVLSELINALHERCDCLGKSRYMWAVNVGTLLEPDIDLINTDLTHEHFCGLPMFLEAWLPDLMNRIEDLLRPPGGVIDLNTRHTGFATSPTNTGLGEEGDLWTTTSVRADAGLDYVEVGSPFYLYPVLYCKAMLDRMLYPVIYPSGEIVAGMENYLSNYDTVDHYDVEAIWDHTKGYPAWRASLGLPPSTTNDLFAAVSAIGSLISNPPPVYAPYYTAEVRPGATWELSNLNNESGTGYLGEVVTQWMSMQCTRPGFNVSNDTNTVPVSFLGGSGNIVHGVVEFTTNTPVPLDGTIESDFVSNIMVSTDNPFNGVRTTITGGVTATGVGYVAAAPKIKFITSGIGTTNSGFRHLRQILDISAHLTDQA